MSKLELLEAIVDQLKWIKVESSIMIGAIVLLVLGLIKNSAWIIKGCFALVLLVAFFFNLSVFSPGAILSSSIYLSQIAQHFTVIFLAVGLLLLIYQRGEKHGTEFYFLLLSILVGSIFMMKANTLLVLYLSVELVSFGSYIITNFSFKKQGNEAGIKYLLFGSISSAIMLMGIALLYGTTGTIVLSDWSIQTFDSLLPATGLMLLLFGLFFKASIFPFHVWVPATYQSMPNDATAFISIIPKLAALAVIFRINQYLADSHWVVGVSFVLGILTMIVGSMAALKQNHVRRMISFGAIAHSGFLLPFAFLKTAAAYDAFWWYAVVYAFMNLGVFYLLDFFEKREVVKVEDYAALGDRLPVLGFSFSVILVSLVGLPPVAGFTAKFFLFTSLWESYVNVGNILHLAYLISATFVTLFSLFFYFKIPYQLYLVKSEAKSIDSSFLTKFIATLFSIVMLLLFFAPQLVMEIQQLVNTTPNE